MPRRRSSFIWVAFGILGAIPIAGCSKPKAQREDLATRRFESENQFAQDFRKIYPRAIGFFTIFDGDEGRTIWSSKVGLYGRYILRMKMNVTLDKSGTRAVRAAPPQFSLLEVESVVKDSDGIVHFRFVSGAQRDFDEIYWNVIVPQGGDLSPLGIRIVTDQPLPNFEENWKDF